MAVKTFSIDDFSGGLNTAVAESIMDAKFSPDLENVDFTDTGAITRRNGYYSLTATPMAAFPVYALYRYYQKDGDKYWMSVCGTALWTKQEVSTEVPETKQEAETYYSGGLVTSAAGYSGGNAIRITGTCTFSLPYSTALKVVVYGATNCGSIKLDAGAWASVSGSATGYAYTTSGLSATAHSISVKAKALNSTSGLLLSTNGETVGWVTYDIGSLATRRIRLSLRGNGTVGSDANPQYSTDGARFYQFGTHYSGTPSWTAYTAEVPVRYIRVSVSTPKDAKGSGFYIDALHLNDILVDDFAAVTSWTLGGHTADYTWALSTAQYATTKHIVVDYFMRSATGAWTKQSTTLSATSRTFGFATLNDHVYLNGQYDTLTKFTGATYSAVSASGGPAGGFLQEHKRRLFTAGAATDSALLNYTAVDEPHDWNDGGSIYLAGKDSGGECTGLTIFDNKVFYFSHSRIFALDTTGPDTGWTNQAAGYNAISWKLGCVAPKSLVQTDNALIFLSADGVRAYGYISGLFSSDGSGLIDISENIRPTLNTISRAMWSQAAGAFYNGKYYLSVALNGATTNNAILVYTLPNGDKPGAWSLYTGFAVSCFHVTRGDEYGLYAGSATTGHIYRLDSGTSDNGAAIQMRYVTPQLAPGGFETVKHFKHLHLAAESNTSQSLTVGFNTDDVSPADTVVPITSLTAAQPLRVEVSARGRSIQYEFTSSGAAQPLTISRMTTDYVPSKVR